MPTDYKKTNAPVTTITWDKNELSKDTGNLYESIVIIAKKSKSDPVRK